MFHSLPSAMLERMRVLEQRNRQEREGLVKIRHQDQLRQIPPESGQFISLMAAGAPAGQWIEIGTSAGYSALWLSLACKKNKTKLTTFELNKQKISLAKETFSVAQVEQYIDLIEGNVFETLPNYKDISFCFLDTEKKLYAQCYELVIENMISGGILLADNVISHQVELQSMLDHVSHDKRVDAMVVPIGQGLLLCRKI